MEIYARATVGSIKSWLERAGLEKTEAVLIANHREKNIVKLDVRGYTVASKPTIKYLGVMFDTRLKFTEHFEYASRKAANATASVAKMLSNISASKHCWKSLQAGLLS